MSEESLKLLTKREIGDKVVNALKIDLFDAEHPRHVTNQIKNIPLVRNDSQTEKEAFRKNLSKARHLDHLNISVQRAAAKQQIVKLDQVALRKLDKFKKERMKEFKEQADKRYNSQE